MSKAAVSVVVGVMEEPLLLGRCGDCAARWGTFESWLSRDIFCIPGHPKWRWGPTQSPV